MNKNFEYSINPSREWLKKIADAEDQHESISVGGLAQEVGLLQSKPQEVSWVLGRLVELRRREKGLTLENLANKADIELSEIIAIEREECESLEPRTVYQLALVLGFAPGKLLELAGLAKNRDEHLNDAALRFAARSEPTTKLTREEHDALEEFVKVLAEESDEINF